MRTLYRYMSCFIISLSLTSSVTSSASQFNQQASQVEALLKHKIYVEKQGVGVAVVLFDGDKRQNIHLGFANKQRELPVSNNTLFEIGSITKTFTTTALASMVVEGKVNLEDSVQAYLPENTTLPIKGDKPITLLSLANHSSGLPRLPTNMLMADPLNPYADYTVDHMYQFLATYELPRMVEAQREYSNLGMGLLGHAMANIDNIDYQKVLEKRVLLPLDMTNTTVTPSKKQQQQLSLGYDIQAKPTKHWQLPTLAGAGALYSTSDDMAKYLLANINGSPLKQAIELAQTATANFGRPQTSIGLGWIIQHINEQSLVIHNGATGGYRSFIGFDKKTGKGIVILANSVADYEDIAFGYLTGDLDKIEMKQPVNLSTEQLDKLTGAFQLFPNFVLTVTRENQQLYVQATGQQKLPLTALSETQFEISAVKAKVVFEMNQQGEAIKATLYQGGQVMPGAKI